MLAAHSPVLLERAGSLDGRLVLARRLEQRVGAAVDFGSAEGRGPGARVVAAEGFDDVEFDERALGPAVEREVPVAAGAHFGVVGDGAGREGVSWDV